MLGKLFPLSLQYFKTYLRKNKCNFVYDILLSIWTLNYNHDWDVLDLRELLFLSDQMCTFAGFASNTVNASFFSNVLSKYWHFEDRNEHDSPIPLFLFIYNATILISLTTILMFNRLFVWILPSIKWAYDHKLISQTPCDYFFYPSDLSTNQSKQVAKHRVSTSEKAMQERGKVGWRLSYKKRLFF